MTGADITARRAVAIAQQRRVIDGPAPLFVEACPGSGKTRVIVDRHLAHQTPFGRPGRALVSFTDASSLELRRRCAHSHHPAGAEYPHFIGTIDRFLWQFLVRPALPGPPPRAPHRRWERLRSWDAITAQVGRWHLADFTFRRDPGQHQCRAELRETPRNRALFADATPAQKRAAEGGAVACRDDLWRQGYVTGHEIRIMALSNVTSDEAGARSNLIARFGELVVDEVQDCSTLDLEILGQLRRAWLPLVLVGDLDQAIYAFRDARPDQVREFGRALDATVELTGNWRSSPAICTFAHTLRDARSGRSPDDAVGDHHDEQAPVLLLRSSGNRVEPACATFYERAAELGIPPEHRLVTAHAATRLPASTRWRVRGTQHSGATSRLVWATTLLHQDPSPAEVDEAIGIIERALLRVWSPTDTDGISVETLCTDHSIDRRRLRDLAMTLPLPDPHAGTLKDWCAQANAVLRATPPAEHLAPGSKGRLQADKKKAAHQPHVLVGALPPSPAAASPGRSDVIHQVKGSEADAVLLIIPETRQTTELLDSWEAGCAIDDERLRVLYVAATRARRLLALCVPDTHIERIARLLDANHVPSAGPV